MNLTLEVVNSRDPGCGGEPRKVFGPGGGVIGRAPECDWVLTNPYVHRKHATVRCVEGIFYIESNGTNGVALNNPQALIPQNERRPLKNGDHLYIDKYEIAVNIARPPSEAVGQTPRILEGQSESDNPFGERLPTPQGPGPIEPLDTAAEDLDPLAKLGIGPRGQERAATRQEISWNHTPVEHDHYAPPPIPERQPAHGRSTVRAPTPGTGPVIPEDWNLETTEGKPPVEREGAVSTAQIPPFEVQELLASTRPARQLPGAPPPAPRPPIPPMESVSPVAGIAGATVALRPGRISAAVAQPPPATPPPRLVTPVAVKTGLPADFAALLQSAGVDPATVPAETIASLGRILRSMVQGLIEVLRARAEVKDEMRMSLTRVKTEENNPLKFAANAENALALLLGPRNPAFLPPVEAFEDALNDIRFHQMAMVAGMRAAFEHVLDSFDPQRLQERVDKRAKPAGLLALGTKPRYWEQYALHYQELTEDRDTAFQRLFGLEFAKAYEKQLDALKRNRAKVPR
jgi:type VI secretion system FHA domain protein